MNERILIRFETDAPNGLLWYIGSNDRCTHLSLKVCLQQSWHHTVELNIEDTAVGITLIGVF